MFNNIWNVIGEMQFSSYSLTFKASNFNVNYNFVMPWHFQNTNKEGFVKINKC